MKTTTSFKQTESGKIPVDWDSKQFRELFEVPLRNGLTRPTRVRGNGIKMVNMGELFAHDRISNIVMERVPLSDKEKADYLLSQGDLLFARQSLLISGVGKCSIFLGDEEEVTFEGHLIRVRLAKYYSPLFYYYFFKSKKGKSIVQAYSEQVAASGIRGSDLAIIPVPVPPLTEQRSASKILSELDEKIELNQQMNKTLEAIAKSIFRHWFIDFEFPNEEGKPYKSSGGDMVYDDELHREIPNGWRMGKLSEISSITMGQSPPGETYNEIGEGIPFYQGVRDFGVRFPSRRVFCTAPTRFAQKDDILLSVRAPVGSLNIANEKCCVGRGLAAVRHIKNYQSYLYALFLATSRKWDIFEAGGTVFGAATKSNVEGFEILIPPDALQHRFNLLTYPAHMKIALLEEELRNLSKIRDSLLPKLMSGKIRVPEEVR